MHSLTLPFIDADRMTPPQKDGGKRISPRVWFIAVLAGLFAAWLVARINNYWR